MLLTKEVIVGINGRNHKYYQDLGYRIEKYYNRKRKKMAFVKGQKISVKIEHLSYGSHEYIDVLCDYCKQNIIKRSYKNHINQKDTLLGELDCCEQCQPYKNKQVFNIKYGVDNISQLPNIKEKKKQTCLLNYGVDSPMKDKKISYKSMSNRAISMHKNQSASCSKQQKYLHTILGGELNYPVDNCSLDIGFPNEMIYLEYSGSGHNLRVVLGDCSDIDFKNKEKYRSYYLKNKGWSKIEIISLEDKLPMDNEIIEMINFAKEYIKSKHSWISFDIDNNKIINSIGSFDYDYGKLRKIKNDDLKGVI